MAHSQYVSSWVLLAFLLVLCGKGAYCSAFSHNNSLTCPKDASILGWRDMCQSASRNKVVNLLLLFTKLSDTSCKHMKMGPKGVCFIVYYHYYH
jgi:hypothetical protein